jgi:hypothetical protein
MMARMRVLLAAALLVGGATACSDLTGNNVSAEGAYDLQTVNGQIVPYTYNDTNGNSIFLQSDFYTLQSDGTYQEFRTWRTNGVLQSGNEEGEWSQSSNVVYLTPVTSDFSLTPYQATVRSSSQFGGSRTFTISINGTTAIYSD